MRLVEWLDDHHEISVNHVTRVQNIRGNLMN